MSCKMRRKIRSHIVFTSLSDRVIVCFALPVVVAATGFWAGTQGSGDGGVMFAAWMSGGRDVSFLAAAGMGLGILVLGGIAEYLLTLLLYRAPLSKTAQPAPLRKWL